jgi:signal transduction histidine kinase
MTKNPVRARLPEPARLLLLGVWRDERQALAGDSHFRLLPAATFSEAVLVLAARTADVLVCDLDVYLRLRSRSNGAALEPAALPTLVLVSPGEEERASGLLERDPADFLLRAGGYLSLLPACAGRAASRRDLYWEEVAALLRHEINNPLTGVLGNAELLLAEGAALSDKTRRRLRTIVELAVRLRDVVRHLEARLAEDAENGGNSNPRPAAPAARVSGGVAR